LRVLYANKFLHRRGGAETVLLSEMELMKAAGHEVAVFACDHPDNLESPYRPYFPRYVDYFRAGFLEKAGAALRIVRSGEAKAKFGRLLDDFKPDVVHAHNIYAQLSFSILEAARERGVRVVMTAHDYKLVCPNYLMLDHGKPCEKCLGHRYHHCLAAACHKEDRLYSAINTVEAYFNHWTDKVGALAQVLCPSAFMMGKLASGLPTGKLRLVRNPIEVKPEGGRDGGYFLYAGRLSPEKGVWELVRAFRETGLPLKVAGTGPMEAALRRQAEGCRVELLGHLEGERLEEVYRGAKACLVPSQWYENAPLAVLEPMAYGKPVLAAAIGGIPELVTEGVTGRLFDPFDREDLKRVVSEVAGASAGSLRDMGRRARDWVGKELTPRRHYEELLGAYRG